MNALVNCGFCPQFEDVRGTDTLKDLGTAQVPSLHPGSHYPRTVIALEAELLAIRLSAAARELTMLASAVVAFEPGTARRRLNAIKTHVAAMVGGEP